MKLIKENDPWTSENIARYFKDDLAEYVALKKLANDQYRFMYSEISGRTDSATETAYHQNYRLTVAKSRAVLNRIWDTHEMLPVRFGNVKGVIKDSVVKAYRRLERKGLLDEPVIPFPEKRKINVVNRDQQFDNLDWNIKQGENFILYPENERYEVTHAVEGDLNVICTNLDTQETATFDKGELTYKYHQGDIKFI